MKDRGKLVHFRAHSQTKTVRFGDPRSCKFKLRIENENTTITNVGHCSSNDYQFIFVQDLQFWILFKVNAGTAYASVRVVDGRVIVLQINDLFFGFGFLATIIRGSVFDYPTEKCPPANLQSQVRFFSVSLLKRR
jgi:hypothetical protein